MQATLRVSPGAMADLEYAFRDAPKLIPKALYRATNKTADAVEARVVDDISAELALTKRAIRGGRKGKGENIRIRRGDYRSPNAEVIVSGMRMPLIDYKARQSKRGVSYKIGRSGKRTTLKQAFIATMKSGHRGVFMRKKRAAVAKTIRKHFWNFLSLKGPGRGNRPTQRRYVAKLFKGQNLHWYSGLTKRKMISTTIENWSKEAELVSRLPIGELMGPSIGGALSRAKSLLASELQLAEVELSKNLFTQMHLLLAKQRGAS